MTAEQLLETVRKWLADCSRPRQETIDGLKEVRDECDMWIPDLEAEEREENGG